MNSDHEGDAGTETGTETHSIKQSDDDEATPEKLHGWEHVTPLQQRVYKALLAVPPGKVTSYKDLGIAAGMGVIVGPQEDTCPKTFEKLRFKSCGPRAVGRAMKENPFLVRVPCHRVVKSDLSIGGYGGRMARKRDSTTPPVSKNDSSQDDLSIVPDEPIREKIRLLRSEGVRIRVTA
eukprot:Selendium_serpulae@DN4095_c0_g1_i1.p1